MISKLDSGLKRFDLTLQERTVPTLQLSSLLKLASVLLSKINSVSWSMAAHVETPPLMPTPQGRITLCLAQKGEIYKVGHLTIRIIEDGSHTGTCFSLLAFSILI